MQNPQSGLRRSQTLTQKRRAQLFEEYEKVHQPYCHKTINKQFAETGKSFRVKDNRIQLRHPSLHPTTILKTSYPIIDHSYRSYKNTDDTKTMWKTAMLAYKNNSEMQSMKESNVCLDEVPQKIANVSISSTSRNDILGSHSKTTNPGYSRNKSGGFYTS